MRPKPNRHRRPALIFVGLALVLTLAACSESPQPSASKTASPAPPKALDAPATRDERAVVVAFGDSLTAGYGVPPGQSYPDFLQKELDERGLEFRVINEGISGDTSSQGLIRTEVVMTRRPEWVIVEFGANDGLRGLSTERMESNLRKMVGRFESGGAKVVLAGMRLPPNYGTEYVSAFDAVYPRLARELSLPLIPFLLEDVAARPDLNQPDGIHPTVEGNRLVAKHVADHFERFVREFVKE